MKSGTASAAEHRPCSLAAIQIPDIPAPIIATLRSRLNGMPDHLSAYEWPKFTNVEAATLTPSIFDLGAQSLSISRRMRESSNKLTRDEWRGAGGASAPRRASAKAWTAPTTQFDVLAGGTATAAAVANTTCCSVMRTVSWSEATSMASTFVGAVDKSVI